MAINYITRKENDEARRIIHGASQPETSMPKQPKQEPKQVKCSVTDAVSASFGVIEELAEEMREAYDNTPESLQNSGAGEARGEAADALESISDPSDDISEYASQNDVTYTEPVAKRKDSRATRLNNGLVSAYAAMEVLEALEGQGSEDEQSEVESAIEAIQTMIDEAEGVTFPGMFG